MATEVGTLLVRLEARVDQLERGLARGNRSISGFERRSRRSFSNVGRSLSRLGRRFTGIGALIGAAAATFGAAQFVSASIDAASAVDEFEIRLAALTGSQRIAGQALAELTQFAAGVAPSLRDIIEAAATLGSVALGSAERINVLTRTAVNVAAITGLTLEQASQNLQRTLSAGIGAADLFRERGVRAIVEAISEIPNLIDAPLATVETALQKVFGPDGVFGQAGQAFADTLPGALSVTGDALFQLQSAFGEALSPVIITLLRDRIIPLFERLTKAISNNEARIRDGLVGAFNTLLSVVRTVLPLMTDALSITVLVFRTADTVVKSIFNSVNQLDAGIARVLNKVFLLSDEGLAANEAAARASQEASNQSERDLLAAERAFDDLRTTVDAIVEGLQDINPDGVEAAADAAERAAAQEGALRVVLTTLQAAVDPRAARQALQAQTSIQRTLDQQNQALIRRRSTQIAELFTVERQTRQLAEQVATVTRLAEVEVERARNALATAEAADVGLLTAEQQEQRDAAILVLRRNILAAEERLQRVRATGARANQVATQREAEAADRVETTRVRTGATLQALTNTIDAVRELDERRAQVLQTQLDILQAQPGTLEQFSERLTQQLDKANDELNKLSAKRDDTFIALGSVLQTSIADALSGAFDEGGINFAESLADLSGTLLQESLTEVTEDLADSLDSLFENIGGGVGAGIAGALGIATGLIGSLLRDTERDTGASQVASIVDDATPLRGVVRGDTNVPIFQIGRQIQEAFATTENLLRQGNETRDQILRALIGSESNADTTDQVDDAFQQLLGAESSSLA